MGLGSRRIFIGDIHGDSEKLWDLIKELRLSKEDEVIFLGDYIDKGEDSKGVLKILKQVKKEIPSTRFLWGNHDLMLYDWLMHGDPTYINTVDGVKTLQNLIGDRVKYSREGVLYGFPLETDSTGFLNIDRKVKEFLLQEYGWLFNCLEFTADYPEQVAVHGGLNFTKPDPIKDTSNYQKVNIRLNVEGNPLKKPIIVGHTAYKKITLTPDKKMIMIDTGCGLTGTNGKLSALLYYIEMDLYMDNKGKDICVESLNRF